MRSTDLLQVARTDLSRLVIHKLDASCFNNLQQVSKYQVAASLIFATCISIDAFNRLAASCSIRLVKTCYPQACCKLLQQLAASLQISSCSKADFHRLATTWWSQQTCCNLLTTCSKPVKSTTCNKSVAFLAVYSTSFNSCLIFNDYVSCNYNQISCPLRLFSVNRLPKFFTNLPTFLFCFLLSVQYTRDAHATKSCDYCSTRIQRWWRFCIYNLWL